MTRHLDRLLLYDVWANQQSLSSLRDGRAPPRALRWLAHIIGAEYVWIARIEGEVATLPVWPDLDVEDCGARLAELSRRWPELLAGRRESLEDKISYANTQGESWTSTVEDILTHVTIHSAYHRGQIASEVRASGRVPAYTDYIHAVRQKLIE